MKKNTCTRDQAVEYIYGMMSSQEEKVYKKHVRDCVQCNGFVNEVGLVKKTALYRKKIKDSVPSFDLVLKQYESSVEKSTLASLKIIFDEFILIMRRPAMRYAVTFGLCVIAFAGGVFLMSRKGNTASGEKLAVNTVDRTKHADVSKQKTASVSETAAAAVKEKPAIVRSKKTAVFSGKNAAQRDWEFATSGPLREEPVVKNDVLYYGSDDTKVYAIDSKSGKLLWEVGTGGRIISQPVLIEHDLYVMSGDKKLYKLDSISGRIIWKREFELSATSKLLFIKENLYLANDKGAVAALDINGKMKWQTDTGLHIFSRLYGDDDSIYFGSYEGNVAALDAHTGEKKWNYETGSHFLYSSPAEINGKIVIGDTDGVVHGLDKTTGASLWAFKSEGQINTDPKIHNNNIYFASDKLYCLSENGEALWTYTTQASVDINIQIHGAVLTMIDKNNNIYWISTDNGLCMKKINPGRSILSFICADDRLYAGDQDGVIRVIDN
jgi:outer membrane protein assembly factor BamB